MIDLRVPPESASSTLTAGRYTGSRIGSCDPRAIAFPCENRTVAVVIALTSLTVAGAAPVSHRLPVHPLEPDGFRGTYSDEDRMLLAPVQAVKV